MSHRPGILKSAGLTDICTLAGVAPAILRGHIKTEPTALWERHESSVYSLNITYLLFGRRQ